MRVRISPAEIKETAAVTPSAGAQGGREKVEDRVHGGLVTEAACRYGLPVSGLIDFSASVTPLGPPPAVRRALRDALEGVSRYPEPQGRFCRNAAARFHGVPEESVIAANGSAEVIYLVVAALKPQAVVVTAPAFGEYEWAARQERSEIRRIALSEDDGFRLHPDRLIAALRAAGGASVLRAPAAGRGWRVILFLDNPNNPTGNVLPASTLREVARHVPGALLVVDEAFLDFVVDNDGGLVQEAAAPVSNILVLRSLTKFYGLAGVRAGYGVGPPFLIRELEARRDPWSVNVMAQAAAVAALSGEASAYRREVPRRVARERAYLFRALSSIDGLRPHPSAANYVLVNCRGTGIGTARLQAELGPRGLLIRDCASFPGLGPFHFRVAVRRRGENRRLVAALRAAVARHAARS